MNMYCIRLPFFIASFGLLLLLWSCHSPDNQDSGPMICYSAPPRYIKRLPSPFPPLSYLERSQDWGKELYLGREFAREMDLYRALTCFKSALFLVPKGNLDRIHEIEYEIFLAYSLGNKYQEAIEAFEGSHLLTVSDTFPALQDMLILLYDAYIQMDLPERACRVLNLLASMDQNRANKLTLGTAVSAVDIPTIIQTAECVDNQDSVYHFLDEYALRSKSVTKAKTLNAILPGAGYFYVGQKKTALTSFIINALFIAASYQLFERGYIPAAIITTSLELGWYFGGINGAGLAAKEYNDRLYECLGKEMMIDNGLFPVLMLQVGF